jgi:tetratricopeptide (TPR) repeat protein
VRSVFCPAICAILIVSAARADTYLVLPFFNLSKNPNLDWIGESVAETVAEALSSEGLIALDRDDRMEVYRRLSVRPYSQLTKASVVKIGEELDAEHVIFGEFDVKPVPDSPVKSRGSLQLTARVLDLKGMRQDPPFRETGALEDLTALEDHLAWQTLQAVSPNGAPTEAQFRDRHAAVRLDAVESYIRGLVASNPDDKHRFFTQAARLDAHYSQPCFQLGRLLFKKKEYKLAAEWFQRVAPTAGHYHEASFFLGLCRYHSGDFGAALVAFQSVASAVPLSEAYNNLGAAQSRANLADALDNFRRALEGDPNDPAYQFNVGYALWKSGDYPAAAENFRAILARDPNDEQASLLLARSEKQSGPRAGDPRTEGLERLKSNYEESAYWQLKALLQPEKP